MIHDMVVDVSEPLLANNDAEAAVVLSNATSQRCAWLPRTPAGITKLSLSILLLVLLVGFLIACAVPGSPVLQWLLDAVEWIDGLPRAWSCVLMVELYSIVIPFGIPITPLNLVSGFLFGFWVGSIVAIVGTSASSAI